MSMTFPIVMTPRQEAARYLRWFSPLLALILTVLTGGIIFAALGQDPFVALKTFLWHLLIAFVVGLKLGSR